ncbi:MAG: PaaI family thioesterase [Reyranellaceae bacterium]
MNPVDPGYDRRVRDSFARQPFMAHLGARIAALAPGECVVEADYASALTQQHGYFHGGVMASLADSAAGYAAFSLMPADASVLTVEYKLNLMRPGIGERLSARARVIRPGRTLSVVQADVYAIAAGTESLCVTSLQTLMCLHGQPDDSGRQRA